VQVHINQWKPRPLSALRSTAVVIQGTLLLTVDEYSSRAVFLSFLSLKNTTSLVLHHTHVTFSKYYIDKKNNGKMVKQLPSPFTITVFKYACFTHQDCSQDIQHTFCETKTDPQ